MVKIVITHPGRRAFVVDLEQYHELAAELKTSGLIELARAPDAKERRDGIAVVSIWEAPQDFSHDGSGPYLPSGIPSSE